MPRSLWSCHKLAAERATDDVLAEVGPNYTLLRSKETKAKRRNTAGYMGQKRRKCPKKRVSSLLQLRSQRGLPGRTARAFGTLSGPHRVCRTNGSE